MIKCSGCGKPIEKLPKWLAGTNVDFVCNNCPNRTAKSIAFTQPEEAKTSARADDDEHIDEEEVADDLEEA